MSGYSGVRIRRNAGGYSGSYTKNGPVFEPPASSRSASLSGPASGVSFGAPEFLDTTLGGFGWPWCASPCKEAPLTLINHKTITCNDGEKIECTKTDTGVRYTHKRGCTCPNPGDYIAKYGKWKCPKECEPSIGYV